MNKNICPSYYPNLFIVGSPKCGTTSLAIWLGSNPGVYLPKVKEPGYFGSELPSVDLRGAAYTEAEYRNLYGGAQEKQWRCDASTSYLASADAIAQIERATNKSARYIVLLRPPEDLVVSLHAEEVYGGSEPEPELQKAWSLMEEREMVYKVQNASSNSKLYKTLYRHHASLGTHLRRLYDQVPSERVHVILLKDLTYEATLTLKELCGFLKLPYDASIKFPHSNQAKSHLFPVLARLLCRDSGFIGMALYHAKRMSHAVGLAGVRSGLLSALTVRERKKSDLSCVKKMIAKELSTERKLVESVIGRSLY